jgi:hypothetical protein
VTVPAASVWGDLVAPLGVAIVAAGLAAAWPLWQIRVRGRRVRALIRRELQEIGPVPEQPVVNVPWWEHLRKEFVHEDLFAKGEVSATSDFLLTLDADITYKVSQLWLAFRSRDRTQWLYFMKQLSGHRHVGSPKLKEAHRKWTALLAPQGATAPQAPSRGREVDEPVPAQVLDARLSYYAPLAALTDVGSKEAPRRLSNSERAQRAGDLRDWYYGAGGLLLSSTALPAFLRAQACLTDDTSTDEERWQAFSRLRTELKIDLGVRDVAEREIEMGAVAAQTTRAGSS